MHLNLEIINPIHNSRWDDLVSSNQHCTFFHSSAWAKVLYESYQYSPLYFTLLENGNLVALLPVMEVRSILTGCRGVSLPFTDYCEPILSDGLELQELIDHVIKYGSGRGWKLIELRGGRNMPPHIPHYSYFYCHKLDLELSEQEMFSTFRGSTIRNIKKATKEGVKINIHQSFEATKEFYRLNCITRRDHGVPPQPKWFFKNLHDHVISKNLGFVVLASYNGSNIAGAVYFHFGNKAIYKYGASDKGFQHLRANNLVMWEAIKWYSGNGYETLSFGRTEPENDGLRQFKAGWGAREEIIKYFKYDLRRNAFVRADCQLSKVQKQLFRIVPITVSQIVGSVFYKHVG